MNTSGFDYITFVFFFPKLFLRRLDNDITRGATCCDRFKQCVNDYDNLLAVVIEVIYFLHPILYYFPERRNIPGHVRR